MEQILVIYMKNGIHFMIKISPFIVFVILCSCSNIPFPLYERGFESLSIAFSSKDPISIDEEYISKKRYRSIRVRIGRSAPVIMVLVRKRNNIEEWISADRIIIYTYKGKIIKTKGLPHDIQSYEFRDYQLYSEGNSYLVDYIEPKLIEQRISSKYFYKHNKTIENIISQREPILSQVYQEDIYHQLINWRAKNLFYYNNDDLLRSEQYIHPFLGRIRIDFIDNY